MTELRKDFQRSAYFENEIKNDIRALYDGYRQANEGLKAIKETVDEISAKIDRHEVEIRVIKGGKS